MALVGEPQLTWFETASTWLPPNAWVWIAGASLWLAIGALVLPRIFRWRKSGGQQWLAALAFGGFLFSLTANFGVTNRANLGFVLNKATPLRLTPTQTSEVIAALNAGETARRIKMHGNYFFIRTETAAGWIERDQFGLVGSD